MRVYFTQVLHHLCQLKKLDHRVIAKNSRLIVDTRNATKGVSGFAKWKIIKA